MGMRVRVKDLDEICERVNKLLRNIYLRVERRYNYFALDVYGKDGELIDTLASGLTKRDVYNILLSVETVLRLEGVGIDE